MNGLFFCPYLDAMAPTRHPGTNYWQGSLFATTRQYKWPSRLVVFFCFVLLRVEQVCDVSCNLL